MLRLNFSSADRTRIMGTSTADETKWLEKLLECSICLDVANSRIYNCFHGHIICGICAKKVNKCEICHTRLKISQFAEKLANQVINK